MNQTRTQPNGQNIFYKFKSLSNFEHVADILCNKRFYASQFFSLNDPMEGRFDYEPETKKRYLDQIVDQKEKLKICSFASSFSNLLLWAHYADSFRGICIETKVTDEEEVDLVKVKYSDFCVFVSENEIDTPEYISRTILSGKNSAWSYEEEMRIFSKDSFVKRGLKINSVLLGLRTPVTMKKVIVRLVGGNLPVYETEINRSTNSVVKGARFYD